MKIRSGRRNKFVCLFLATVLVDLVLFVKSWRARCLWGFCLQKIYSESLIMGCWSGQGLSGILELFHCAVIPPGILFVSAYGCNRND